MNRKNRLLTAAVAGILTAGVSVSAADKATQKNAPAAKAEKKVECHGINECKGKSECHTATTSCKGENACKGKGWVSLTETECKAKGGKSKS